MCNMCVMHVALDLLEKLSRLPTLRMFLEIGKTSGLWEVIPVSTNANNIII